jgi:ribosomal protein S6
VDKADSFDVALPKDKRILKLFYTVEKEEEASRSSRLNDDIKRYSFIKVHKHSIRHEKKEKEKD